MAELLPDDEPNKCCHEEWRPPKRGPVTDILLWVECFSIMATVLTSDFFTYQKTIVHASRSFSGDHWVTYDLCYRRQAAVRKTLQWLQIDFSLYNETFTGRAKPLPCCKYCLSEHHTSPESSLSAKLPRHPNPYTLKYVCSSIHKVAISAVSGHANSYTSGSRCQEPHPASVCKYPRPPSSKQPRYEHVPLRKP